jgi:hypothetical protein
VAGCPGLEEVRTEPGGRPSRVSASAHQEEGSSEDDTDLQEGDLVSVTDRVGLGCYLFPGCGAFLFVLLVPGILVALVRSLLRSG